MALLITDPKAEQAVLALTQVTGESVEEAITHAAEARLNLLSTGNKIEPGTSRKRVDMEAVYALLKKFDALPRLDHRTPDEILGYDENGLPT